MSVQNKQKTFTGVTDGSGDATLILNETNLGYQPDHLYCVHTIQVAVSGGTNPISLQFMTLAGTFTNCFTAVASGAILTVGGGIYGSMGTAAETFDKTAMDIYIRPKALKIVIASAGSPSAVPYKVFIRSDSQAW